MDEQGRIGGGQGGRRRMGEADRAIRNVVVPHPGRSYVWGHGRGRRWQLLALHDVKLAERASSCCAISAMVLALEASGGAGGTDRCRSPSSKPNISDTRLEEPSVIGSEERSCGGGRG